MAAIFGKWIRVIRSHPLRNFLLILTTTIGTGALALSLQTTSRLDRLVESATGGQDRRIVIANAKIGVDGELSWTMPFQFRESDRESFASDVKGIKVVSVVNRMPMDQIKVNEKYWKPSDVLGTDSHYADVMGLKLIAGSFFSAADLASGNKVAVISSRAAKILFGSDDAAVGKTIAADNGFRMANRGLAGGRGVSGQQQNSSWTNYVVAGVFADPTKFEFDNYGIADYLIPYSSMLPSGMNFSMPVRMFVARIRSTAVENVESAIRSELDSRSGSQVNVAVWEGSPDSPGVSAIEKARKSLSDLSLVTSGLGVLILMISAFGIVSGLLVDAADRAKEIALKRSLGMTIRRGTLELCARSMALSGAGGALGLALATLASLPMRDVLVPYLAAIGISSTDLSFSAFELKTVLAPVAALALSFAFSLLPAARAASVPIVSALKE